MDVQTINPTTEEVLATYSYLNANEIDEGIDNAHTAFLAWRQTSLAERAALMRRMAELLRQKNKECATLISKEMGKLLTEAMAEVDKCALVCDFYADKADTFLQPEAVQTNMKKSLVCYQPLGVIFAVMPWNYPFWQVFRYAAPGIMAGNTTVLKHASVCIGSGEMIQSLFEEAGFPRHIFQHMALTPKGASHAIANEKVAGVTLTGSEGAGSAVAAEAGKHIKRVVLELGGSDPYVVLEDADLDQAAACIVKSRMKNCGQVCIAAKRAIIVEPVYDALVEKIEKAMSEYRMGDPAEPLTNLPPMARADLRDGVHDQVQRSVKAGATLRLGGILPGGTGFYYPATLLTDVKPGMPAFDEELFGPVLSVISAKDEAEAIQLANNSKFGLGAAVFTRDLERGQRIAMNDIHAGSCFVNASVSSDPRLPFGGIKSSGFGRELSKHGMLEFMNIKTVSIAEV